jgi:hypothetical protein
MTDADLQNLETDQLVDRFAAIGVINTGRMMPRTIMNTNGYFIRWTIFKKN